MIDWVTAKITCTHNPEVLSSGRSIRLRLLMALNALNMRFATALLLKGHTTQI